MSALMLMSINTDRGTSTRFSQSDPVCDPSLTQTQVNKRLIQLSYRSYLMFLLHNHTVHKVLKVLSTSVGYEGSTRIRLFPLFLYEVFNVSTKRNTCSLRCWAAVAPCSQQVPRQPNTTCKLKAQGLLLLFYYYHLPEVEVTNCLTSGRRRERGSAVEKLQL